MVIRFRIGQAFPAEEPVARFMAVVAMIGNDWLRNVTVTEIIGEDRPEAIDRRLMAFRHDAAFYHEASKFLMVRLRHGVKALGVFLRGSLAAYLGALPPGIVHGDDDASVQSRSNLSDPNGR